MSELSELLPCPFCGSDELAHGYQSPGLDGSDMTGMVQCHNCNALLFTTTEAEAIAAWNRRQTAAVPNIHEAVNSLVRQCESSHECWEAGADCFCVTTAASIVAAIAADRGKAVPAGHVVAPKEPTKEMIEAGCEKAAEHCGGYNLDPYDEMVGEIYTAAIRARPAP